MRILLQHPNSDPQHRPCQVLTAAIGLWLRRRLGPSFQTSFFRKNAGKKSWTQARKEVWTLAALGLVVRFWLGQKFGSLLDSAVGLALGPAVGLSRGRKRGPSLDSGRAWSCCLILAGTEVRITPRFCRRSRARSCCRTLARKEAWTQFGLWPRLVLLSDSGWDGSSDHS